MLHQPDRRPTAPPGGTPRPLLRRGLACALWLLAAIAARAEPPEVVRVRVPTGNVAKFFPPGTELRGLSTTQFEALVDSARAGYQRQANRRAPRLLQARHFARWEAADGLLIGRSELLVEPSPAGPSRLVLDPWTPAVARGDAAAQVEAQLDGRTALRVEGNAPATAVVRWQLRARPGSRGCGFTLGLPTTETARLVLDLPEGWFPDGPPGIRQGPEPAAEPKRRSWQFDGTGGPIDLHLRDSAPASGPQRDAQVWVSGPTRVELLETSANWTMDWTVDAGRGAPGPAVLALLLDPGLELVDVTGSEVDGYQAEATGAATRVTVRLEQGTAPTIVSVRAVARVPSEGAWAIPAARPEGALWTGGTTLVRLDGSRILEECRERAGRRVGPAGEANDPRLLVFEGREPRPVAELVFRKPGAEVSSEVRGRLFLGGSAPRLECQMTWRVHRGPLLGFEVDLPPAWVPDRVRIAGVDEPVDWHPEVLADGAVRVHVVPPAITTDRAVPTLTVEATATIAGGRGPLALPRVRPVGVRIADELWVAWTDPSLSLRPTAAKGLAWIDPRLAAAPAASTGTAETEPEGMRGTLAWRWIAPPGDAEARVDRERLETEPGGTVDLRARVGRTQVRYEWQMVVQAGEDTVASIAVGTTAPWDDPADWHFEEETTGLDLRVQPLTAPRRTALGLPAGGRAWELFLPHPRRGRVVVRARLEQRWTGRGTLPLLVLPEQFHTRGTVLIEVDRGLRSQVEATGLRALDPMVAAPATAVDDAAMSASLAYRRAHAFGYTSGGGRLELRTENLEPTRSAAVIREAVLTTTFNPHGASGQHLTLRIAADRTQELKLALPAGTRLTRVERDGTAIVPSRQGQGLAIPLVAPHGARSYSTVTLDYVSDVRPREGEGRLHPPLPATSVPCLSFCWEILAPAPWSVADASNDLLATDPKPSASRPWPWSLPRQWRSSWRTLSKRLAGKTAEPAEVALLRPLDALVVATRPDEVTLGEWFTRWDSGSPPLVIDRVALASAGWGPKSRVVPPRFAAPRPGAAQATLLPLGLTVVPIGGTFLITAQREAPQAGDSESGVSAGRAAWEAAMVEAVAWGHDHSDRFQSVTSWRGEATPKVSIRGESTESEPLREGWRYWRLAAAGWPGTDAWVRLIDEQRRAGWAWSVGLAIVLVGIAARRTAPRLRAAVLTLALAAAIVALTVCPARLMPVAWAALAGVLGVALLWLGASVPLPARRRSRELRSSSTVRRLNPGATASTLLALLAAGGAVDAISSLAIAERSGGQAIVALFPYDGAPDADRAPDRVILRRQDAEQLEALASSGRQPSVRQPYAQSAIHRVFPRGEREIAVESTYVLGRDPGGVATWTFPVQESREISATLDHQPVPVQVEKEGRTASVALSGPGDPQDSGRCLLQIRRIVGLRPVLSEDVLELAINAVADAEVVVEDILPDRPHIQIPSARGRVGPRLEGPGVAGLLGPADRLEVRWSARDEPGPSATGGAVEALLLWDAAPAGDHVQARLTYRRAGGTSTIRLGLEPGMVLRNLSLDGRVDAAWQGSDERPEWVASIDPPLADGATVQLEFWRPAPSAAAEPRALPQIEPMGVERYTGALGFRRPPGWSGRLGAGAGLDFMTDEAFVKAWGNLSEEPLTFAGTVRFGRLPAVSVATGPPPAQVVVDPSVQLTIEPGRIALSLSAEITTVSGRCDRVELAVPAGLEIVTVEADGLADWSRPVRGRVVLRFTGGQVNRREARIQAWLPVPSDPLATGVANPQIDVPWPRWLNAEVRPGQLTIASPTRFQLVQSSGATLLGPAAGPGNRTAYRVNRPDGLGQLTWDVEPPRLGVLVQSQLTILPDFAQWVAVLRYDVSGGGAEAVHLKLPSTWAATARVQVVGDSHQLASETKGANTFWMIRPDHPIWGSQRVIVRSVIPLPKTGAIAFPDLSPLGRWGAVDSYLALINASGRELVTEGSPGLQLIADDSHFRAEEFAGTAGVSPSVYHVRREGWTLKVHGPGELRSTDRSPEEARVLLAELSCTLRHDGTALGLAVFEIESRSGPFLALDPPENSEPLWATVNNMPAPPFLSASGRWLIPIPNADEGPSPSQVPVAVRLIWKSAPNNQPSSGLHRLPLPALGQPKVPTFLTIHTPAAVELNRPGGSLEPVPRERLEIARLEWQGRRISDALGKLDRSSQRECEALVSSLVQFELLKRDAERAARWNVSSPAAFHDVRVARLDERVRIASRSLADALGNAALDEFAESARIHVGLVADDPSSSTLEIPEPSTNVRIRRLGHPRYFYFDGDSALNDRESGLTWTTLPEPTRFDQPLDWVVGVLCVVASVLVVTFAVTIAEPVRWPGPTALAASLIVLAMAFGPLALAWGFGMAGLGWFGRTT